MKCKVNATNDKIEYEFKGNLKEYEIFISKISYSFERKSNP